MEHGSVNTLRYHPTDYEERSRMVARSARGCSSECRGGSNCRGSCTLSGQVAAHFPAGLELDIKPGIEDNPINTNNHGVIPVAVLQTDVFDPTGADVRYRFGAPDVVSAGDGARPAHGGHVEDVDGDGREDVVLHFPTDGTGFDGDESEGRLEWERDESGQHGLSGTDTVTVVDEGSQ